jgi:hypothetical protein
MPATFRTIIEPFRIHSVEPIRITTAEEPPALRHFTATFAPVAGGS